MLVPKVSYSNTKNNQKKNSSFGTTRIEFAPQAAAKLDKLTTSTRNVEIVQNLQNFVDRLIKNANIHNSDIEFSERKGAMKILDIDVLSKDDKRTLIPGVLFPSDINSFLVRLGIKCFDCIPTWLAPTAKTKDASRAIKETIDGDMFFRIERLKSNGEVKQPYAKDLSSFWDKDGIEKIQSDKEQYRYSIKDVTNDLNIQLDNDNLADYFEKYYTKEHLLDNH